MTNPSVKKLVLSSLFLALSIVLPLFISPIPEIGQRLLPMHIPVLLCGFFCGWKYGFLVGVLAPLLKTFFPPAPPLFPIAIAMSFELGAYGLLTGLLYHVFPKKNSFIYMTLVTAMIFGRIIYGLVISILFLLDERVYTMTLFISSTVIDAIPGIILQLLIIPVIVIAIHKLENHEGQHV